jgi:hypothetical protein
MNDKNVILDIGLAFDYSTFQNLIDSSIYNILYIGESEHVKLLLENIISENIEFIDYEILYVYEIEYLERIRKHDIVEVMDIILNDKITIDLYDRIMAPYLFNYATKSEVKLISMILSSYKFLMDKEPAFLLFYECPHNINSWIIARVAECIGIPVRYCRNHIFAWRNVLLEGMNKQPALITLGEVDELTHEGEYELFLDIESRYSKGLEFIKPEFVEVLGKQKRVYSFWADFKKHWKKPQVFLYKYLCYKSYEKLSKDTIIPDKYVLFYLHLQPERTTLPEGYGFTQQYKALSVLNEALPADCYILVKEHPATFYRYCVPCGRWPSYYKSLRDLKKVKLLPIDTDPYSLMSDCMCVCTITGTIAREALMSGKPVINFGLKTLYKSLPLGMYNYKNYDTLHTFIDKLSTFTLDEIKQSFRNIVRNEVLTTGTIGIEALQSWNNSDNTIYNSNAKSRFKLLKYILSR